MKKNILIGVTSGIAAYKVLELIKLLKNEGHEVFVIMTKGATEMISPQNFEKASGNKIFINLFEKNFDYREVLKKRKVEHIELADETHVMGIPPATPIISLFIISTFSSLPIPSYPQANIPAVGSMI